MSCVCVIAPMVIVAWPTLSAAIVAAAVSAGFRIEKNPARDKKLNSVEVEVPNAEVLQDAMRRDESMVVERNQVRVIFTRDARGQLKTCVEGPGSKDELKRIGEDLSGRVIQQFVYQRLTQELSKGGFTMVREEAGPDRSIRLQVRRFEE